MLSADGVLHARELFSGLLGVTLARLRIAELNLELRRRGGWSWGPDPRGLAESLQRALPALVARELRRLLPRELSGRVSAPIRVHLRLSTAELGELLVAAERSVPGAGVPGSIRALSLAGVGPPAERFRQRVRAALAHSIAALPPESFAVAPLRAAATASQGVGDDEPEQPLTRWAGSLLRMLTAWRKQGDLAQLLASVDATSLQRWHELLLVESPARASGRSEDVAGAVAALGRVLEAIEHEDPRARRAAERLLLVVLLHEQLGLRPDDPLVRAELERALPSGRVSSPGVARGSTSVAPSGAHARQRRVALARPRTTTRPAAARTQLQAGAELRAHALPFLVLASLARLGWVELLGALLLEREALAGAPALASALAFKLLPVPRRGWMRTTADELSAAAFAGEGAAIEEARRARVASLLADALEPLDLLLTRSLVRGRDDRDPLLLLRAPLAADDEHRGWLALELEGGFVLARALELDALLDAPALADAPLLIPASEADPATTRLLVARERVFLTDAVPGRGDQWRAIRRGRLRLWTTAPEPGPFTKPARFASLFEVDEQERLRGAWTEVVARPGVLRGPRPELERSLNFAVHLALADLAWNLWRTREATDAGLSYQRFADLDVRLRVERDRVRLLLPRGARRDHLAAAGMLADLGALPWWPGRRLEWGVG